jgi:hypothetical protein
MRGSGKIIKETAGENNSGKTEVSMRDTGRII